MKLNVIVFTEHCDLYSSEIYKKVLSDFARAFKDGYDESCTELPSFKPVPFYKKLIYWFEYQGTYHVFISSRLQQQELGRVEHCIYTLTGLRGVGNHINSLELLGSPNTPMKKFLLKRL